MDANIRLKLKETILVEPCFYFFFFLLVETRKQTYLLQLIKLDVDQQAGYHFQQSILCCSVIIKLTQARIIWSKKTIDSRIPVSWDFKIKVVEERILDIGYDPGQVQHSP